MVNAPMALATLANLIVGHVVLIQTIIVAADGNSVGILTNFNCIFILCFIFLY